jgi:uncharacterized damage-inducible protein DinB
MSLSQAAAGQIAAAQEYFNRSTRSLTEQLSGFAPSAGMFTVAQQVAHVAQTVEWFIEGAFRPEGFNMDFEAMDAEVRRVTSLAEAREWLGRAFAAALRTVAAKSDAELLVPLPAGPIMGGLPRMAIFGAITDHTAHHRGALTVYSRLNGITPPMPYMEM